MPAPPVAIRPGEHACCRFAHPRDEERAATGFVSDGIRRGHKILYVSDAQTIETDTARLAGTDDDIGLAFARGQLDIISAQDVYLPDGRFELERMVGLVREAHAGAMADGYAGLSATGGMSWALTGAPGCEQLEGYERQLARIAEDDTLRMMCRYDEAQFGLGSLDDIAAVHDVDVSPDLASIGRTGILAAAREAASGTLRLAGELDFAGSDDVAHVLAAHVNGPRRLDLGELEFIDVAGMRALRGGGPVTIVAASKAVRRLLALLAWDTDPAIEMAQAA